MMMTMFTKMKLLKYLPGLVMLCGIAGNVWAQAPEPPDPVPSFYQESGKSSRTREYINQSNAEHIDPFTGKLQYHHVDLFTPGNGGLDLKLQRSYNSFGRVTSNVYEDSPMGLGWTMNFGRLVVPTIKGVCGPSGLPVFELSDGTRRVFYRDLNGGNVYVSTDFWRAECGSIQQNIAMVFTSPDGTRYETGYNGHTFDFPITSTSHNVSKITDKNGNWIKIEYQYLPNLISGIKSVMTSDGRAALFEYGYQRSTVESVTEGDIITAGSNIFVQAKPGGRKWIYSYTKFASIDFLTQVTLPNGENWKYEYQVTPGAAGYLSLRQVTQPTGGIYDYTYSTVDFTGGVLQAEPNVVLTQKVATKRDTVLFGQNAAPTTETWTYEYLPATQRLPLFTDTNTNTTVARWSCTLDLRNYPYFDRTTVTGPDEVRTIAHFGNGSIHSGLVHLLGSKVCSAQTNQVNLYGYASVKISEVPVLGPQGSFNAVDPVTYAAIPDSQSINRLGESFNTVSSNFDSFGNPQTITETGSHTKVTNITYNNIPAKWIIRQKKDETQTEGAETLTTTRTFDAIGNMLSQVQAGVPTTYTYHPSGDLASVTDARLKTTQYTDYYRGIARLETQPGGIPLPLAAAENVLLTRTVSDAGNVTSETDGEGATTSFTYDGLNRVTGITHPLGNPVTVAWGANTKTVTRGNYVSETTYDSFGREAQSKHTDNTPTANKVITQKYKVDSLGRRTFASYPNNSIGTKYSYDLLNRQTIIFHEFDPGDDSYSDYQSNLYRSFEIIRRNERGIKMAYKYRTYGNPDNADLMKITRVDSSNGALITVDTYATISRNILGQMTNLAQDGVNRTYSYNANFYLTAMTEPETGTTVMGRDAIGNLISKQIFDSINNQQVNSLVTTYSYDDRNRLASITYPAGTPSVIKRYFKDDKLKSIDNGISKRTYVYDANKNLSNETLTVGAKVFPLVHTYNANDAHTSMRYGSNKIVNYAPDAFGRPTQATPYVTSVAYHPSGNASNYTFANGVVTTMNQDDRQRPNTIKATKSSNIIDMYYYYDGVGNVLSINDSVDPYYDRNLKYDSINRLTQSNTQTFLYNLNGDIDKQNLNFGLPGNSLNYEYDPVKRRLLNVSGINAYAMQYDVYGNVTNNGKNTFAYNDASQLKCANCGFPNEILYEYDGNGIRTKSRKNNTDTFYMYGISGQLLWEETPNNSLKEYIYLGGKQIATREQILP
jgi:YD repeat-containing protein